MKLRFFTLGLLGWVLFCNFYFVQDLVGEVYRDNDKKYDVVDAKNLLEKFPDNLIHDVVDFQLDHVVFPFLHQRGLLDYKYKEVSRIINQRVKLFLNTRNVIEISQLYLKNPKDAAEKINSEIRDDIKKSVENYFISHGRERIDQLLLNVSYKHAHEVARVRVSKSIPVQEAAYIKQRKENARIALSKLLKRDITKIPTIAVVASGGGMRATLATLGFLRGLEDIGLLDAVSYVSTLSGSTWLAATWMMGNFTLDQLETKLVKSIENGLVFPENSDSR
ncbi:MAG TPA: hypothetical protein VJ201_04030, partial [Candidatus Babeliales bacterium]|nr:hypothetical protein [Candidatus Babeliales bacterium]